MLRTFLLALCLGGGLGLAAAAGAQTPLVPPPGAAAPAAAAAGLWPRVVGAVRDTQRDLHRRLAVAVRAFKQQGSAAAGALILVSLLYGVFHAVGPGHGKAVISAYLLANESAVRRGVLLAFLASLVQGLSAVLLVGLLAALLGLAGVQVTRSVSYLESASYALVALIGAWMLWSQLRGGHRHHHHHHGDTADAACGHGHVPDPALLSAPAATAGARRNRVSEAAGLVLAVGIRPCSGAVLVLLFALAHGVLLAGVAATFAMSLGTAVTVSLLAVLTLFSKRLALAVVGGDSRRVEAIYRGLALLGAGLLLLLGGLLFWASLAPAGPL
ncbi:nickel/cobalt transporter [Pelagibius sp. CAU 1746]|uniref:nickel/cobalt transporter n=1 Tax=Pelagibius sp. CAU 1746 TaxID=3140370 RepID=UPI00325BCF9C